MTLFTLTDRNGVSFGLFKTRDNARRYKARHHLENFTIETYECSSTNESIEATITRNVLLFFFNGDPT